MKKWLFFLPILIGGPLLGQTNIGLVAYYPFNLAITDATGNTANAGFLPSPPEYGCGITGEALAFRGIVKSDYGTIVSPISLKWVSGNTSTFSW